MSAPRHPLVPSPRAPLVGALARSAPLGRTASPGPPAGGTGARLGLVFTAGQARAAGFSRHTCTTLVRRGEWVRLRLGVYCLTRTWESADRRERHLLHAAAAQCCWGGSVVSHLSGAAAWELPLPLGDLGDPWLTVDSGRGRRPVPGSAVPAGGRDGASAAAVRQAARHEVGAHVEAAALLPIDAASTLLAGQVRPVTSLARTVADCLRHLPALDAVAIADAAAARGLPRADLAGVLARQAEWPYASRAASSLLLVDPRREGWLESVGAVVMRGRGIPRPEAQAVVRDERGRFVARVDDWWPREGIIAELDGREKYRLQGLASPQDAERLLREEKDREDRLRDLGHEVVRAATPDVLSGLVADRWYRALERARPGRIRGTVTPAPWPVWWPRP